MLISWRPNCKFKIVIIGGGAIGEKIAQAIKVIANDNIRLVAVYCRTAEKAGAFARKYDCRAYSDLVDPMLEKEKPDLAIICTPSGDHLAPALLAIKRGINVLIEKPVEVTREGILQIASTAEQMGVIARGIFQKRYSVPFLHLRQAIREGRFGAVNKMKMGLMVPWYRPRSYFHYPSGERNWKGTWKLDGGGATMNQGIHGIDMLLHLIGQADPNNFRAFQGTQRITSISGARAGNVTPGLPNVVHDYIEAEDSMICAFEGFGGIEGSFMASTCLAPGFDQTLKISGSNGAEVVLREDVPAVWKFPGTPTDYDTLIHATISQAGSATSASANPMAIGVEQHADCVLDTLQHICEGDPLFDLSVCAAGTPVLAALAMYESARQNGASVSPDGCWLN